MYFGGYKNSIGSKIMGALIASVLVFAPYSTTLYATEENVEISTGDAAASLESATIVNSTDIETEIEGGEEEGVEVEEVPEETNETEEDTDNEETTNPEDEQAIEDTDLLPETDEATTTVEQDIDTSSSTPHTSTEDNTHASTTATTTTNIDIETESDAQVNNVGTTTANTGGNTASSTGNSTIETGDAYSDVNILNITNTNTIDSYGFILLLNSFMQNTGTIDVRNLIEPLKVTNTPTGRGSSCGSGPCGGDGETRISNTSTSTINNSVVVRAQTGDNTATGNSTGINTGDAYAGANVVNIANTNIIDSNYMLLAVNNFGDWAGDLVLPGKDYFTNMLYGMGSSGDNITVQTNNTAQVDNNISIEADTGNNTATSTEESTIETGDAVASANVSNTVNSTFFNQDSLYILFRVHGNWNGNVFGLPPGLSWRSTPGGVEIFGSGSAPLHEEEPEPQGNLNILSDNDAQIKNNINVYALTGENQAEGSSTSIETGNAYAGANLVNMANTNIIGRNWVLAIVNIFGDWNGNLSFGRPDLWLGAKIVPVNPWEPIGPGSEMEFHITVVNRGDSDATDVHLTNHFDVPFMEFVDRGISFERKSMRDTEWNIGTVPAGQHVEFVVPAVVKDERELVSGTTVIESTLEVRSFETDADLGDNMEKLSVMIENYSGGSYQTLAQTDQEGGSTTLPQFEITKLGSSSSTVASSSVDYTITLRNTGGFSPDTVVIDTLKNETGEVVTEQVWELGPVYEDEEINISYTSVYAENTLPGLYTNYATVMSQLDSGEIVEAEAFHEIEIIGEVEVEELVKIEVEETIESEDDTVFDEAEDEGGITLLPPQCSINGCSVPFAPVKEKRRSLLANAFGAGFGFPFGTDNDRPIRMFLLAAVMFAVYRKGGKNNPGNGASVIF